MYLKLGFAGKLFSMGIGVCLAVMLSLSLANIATVRAEQSDEMREFLKKQKLRRSGLVGANVSTHDAAPAASGKATTETEVFTGQVVEPMLSLRGAAEIQAAEDKYAAIVSNRRLAQSAKGHLQKRCGQ